jgi:hypothetical protein
MGLGERVRARVEDAGRVILSDGEAQALVHTKVAHITLVVVSCLAAVVLSGASQSNHVGNAFGLFFIGMALPAVAFFVGAALEGFWDGDKSAAQLCVHIAKCFGARMLSFIMLVVFILILTVGSGSSGKDAEADGEQIMPRHSSGD